MTKKVGFNLQTIPPAMKPFLLADDGKLLLNIDLSQAENRLVAWLGPVPEQQEAFASNIDLHSHTYSLMFRIPIKKVSKEKGSAELGDGVLSQRDVGKKSNHSLNYGISFKTFSLQNQIPETTGKDLLRRYHRAYPGIRGNYQEGIKNSLYKTRTLTTPFGRRRRFLSFLNEDTFREGYSFIPQATVAYIINEWGLQLIYYEELFSDWELLLQVHDSLLVQVPIPSNEAEVEKLTGQLLSLKHSLEQEIPPGPLGSAQQAPLVIPCDFSLGFNYGDKTESNKKGLQELVVSTKEDTHKALQHFINKQYFPLASRIPAISSFDRCRGYIWWVSSDSRFSRSCGAVALQKLGIRQLEKHFADIKEGKSYLGLDLRQYRHIGDVPKMVEGKVVV